MICIYCSHKKTRITNSRPSLVTARVWRRHQCPNCGAVFSSYETAAAETLIVKADSKQPFSLGKLHLSIAACFSHNPLDAGTSSLELALTIQATIAPLSSISAHQLAEQSYQTLQRFDPLVAMQYGLRHHLVTSTRQQRGRPSLKRPPTSSSPSV